MQKVKRLIAIERIIRNEKVSSQEALGKRLKREGLACTQATLSRNLRQLGVLRIPDGKGRYRYSMQVAEAPGRETGQPYDLVSAVTGIIDANSMVLIKTRPGYASSVAVMIDSTGRYEIAGTIAGDDTLLIIPRDRIGITNIHKCLEIILPGLHEKFQ